MSEQRITTKRTLVKFGVQTTTQIAGKGASTTWEIIKVPIGTDADGAAAIQQQAEGVKRSARVRLPYVKAVYDALTTKQTRIYLYGKTDEAHTFVLASDADDYLERHKFIEFQVKHYGGK